VLANPEYKLLSLRVLKPPDSKKPYNLKCDAGAKDLGPYPYTKMAVPCILYGFTLVNVALQNSITLFFSEN
jgi:hypothetical protein